MELGDLHVLLVDDFPAMRKLLTKSLREMGVSRILEARDGTEAVQLLLTNKIDLLISDWNMPDMGGLELLRWVRANCPWGRMPFLMVTAKGQQMDVVQAVRAGVDAYMVKPFTQEGLEAKVAKLLPLASAFAGERDGALEQAAASCQAPQVILGGEEGPEAAEGLEGPEQAGPEPVPPAVQAEKV